jgi:hypothetical protein
MVSVLAALVLSSSSWVVPSPEQQIYDGMPAESCQWPTQTMLGFGGCSSTLVTPWIVTTAAHCVGDVESPGEILFGESFNSPQRAVMAEYCRRNPEWDPSVDNGVGGADIAFCKLAEPVYDIPFTPIVYGCETEILSNGREVWMVGIGANADDDSGFGLKRFSSAPLSAVTDDLRDGVTIGTVLNAGCPGDSGGPAYVQFPDGSWRAFGVVSGGPQPCGAGGGQYAVISAWVPWIEETSGMDVTPCHDVDGTWNPTGWCQGFEMDPMDAGDWDDWCVGELSPPAETCGPAFDAEPDDAAPTVTVTLPHDEMIFEQGPANVTIELDANDGEGHGVRFVRVEINGMVQEIELREPPYAFSGNFPQGGYLVIGTAEDWAGNVGESEIVRFAVDADLPPLPEEETSSSGSDSSTGTPDPTTTTGDATTGEPETGSSGDDPPAGGDADGCGCRSGAPRGIAWFALLVVAAARRRSRFP